MENQDTGLFRFLIKQYRRWNNFRMWFASALDADIERKTALYIDLSRSATLKDLVYWLQILFSAGIATLGLVQNSSAVIIGAMLISPLMAPILAAGLALATGDITLGVRAVANLFVSTLLGMGFAVILVGLLPYNEITAEISARTRPNTLDLLIALFSGAIGAIATCRETKGVVTSIPGVAIAVALMPPLGVVGYGIGIGGSAGWEIAWGGGLLYLTNLVAITFTAMLVFVLLRIDRKKVRDAVRVWRDNDSESQWWLELINRIPRLEKAREVRSFTLRLLMVLIPLAIIYVPLSQSFSKLRMEFQAKQEQNRVREDVLESWNNTIANRPFSELDELRVADTGEKFEVYIRAFSDSEFSQEERAQLQNLIAGSINRKPDEVSVQLVVIPTSARAAPASVVEAATPIPLTEMRARVRQRTEDSLSTFKLPPPAELVDYRVADSSTGNTWLTMYYLSRRDIQQDARVALQDTARRLLDLPNLTLSLSRISSETTELPFVANSAEFETESENMVDLVSTLREHKSLSVRLMLLKTNGQSDLYESRKSALDDFLFVQNALAQDRVVFTETDDPEIGNTYQLFIKN
ncbi:MAG: DUF389 domain-containing protein [Pyrinomonadaceae bacterium]|nr:DUF389 domain-containing protein [Pyrinomonadaceae bacterium]